MIDVLVSYAYWNKRIEEYLLRLGDEVSLLVDSGAFTAFKTGKVIELDDYCRFLERIPIEPWRYFTLDVIGDSEETERNYETMLARGFNPIPVFTKGESVTNLERMYETSDLVGFGGLAGRYNKQVEGYLKVVLRYAKGRDVHLLGYSSLRWIKSIRPYSCDSTTWCNGGRYGAALVYFGNGVTKLLTRPGSGRTGDCVVFPGKKAVDVISSYGLDPGKLQKDASWIGNESIAWPLNIITWLLLQRDIRKNIGTRVFLATGSAQIEHLVRWYAHTKEMGLLDD